MTRSPRHPDERSGEPQPVDPFDTAVPADPGTGSPTADVPAVLDESVTGPDAGDEAVGAAPARPATHEDPTTRRTLAGGAWAALIIGALLLILLLVFILQNQQQVELNLFAWTFQFPAGVGYLFSAIAGALIMALVGGVRMIELHRQVRKLRKQHR